MPEKAMVELSGFRREYVKTAAWACGHIAVTQLFYGLLLAYWLWKHESGLATTSLMIVLANSGLLFVRTIALFWVTWHMPAVWIANDRLYAGSPFRFRMHMDDISSWRFLRHSWGGTIYHHLALTNRKGKERRILLDFIADKDQLRARLTHILGPQTQMAAADATAKA